MKGYGVGDKYSQDPINSHESRGKNREQRKHRNDPGFTPTETHIRNKLMRQFMKSPEGTDLASSEAYNAASCWCAGCDGRRLASKSGLCESCWLKGYGINERHAADPVMRQFMKSPEGTDLASEGADLASSEAYKYSPAWCENCDGRRLNGPRGVCESCWEALVPDKTIK